MKCRVAYSSKCVEASLLEITTLRSELSVLQGKLAVLIERCDEALATHQNTLNEDDRHLELLPERIETSDIPIIEPSEDVANMLAREDRVKKFENYLAHPAYALADL